MTATLTIEDAQAQLDQAERDHEATLDRLGAESKVTFARAVLDRARSDATEAAEAARLARIDELVDGLANAEARERLTNLAKARTKAENALRAYVEAANGYAQHIEGTRAELAALAGAPRGLRGHGRVTVTDDVVIDGSRIYAHDAAWHVVMPLWPKRLVDELTNQAGLDPRFKIVLGPGSRPSSLIDEHLAQTGAP